MKSPAMDEALKPLHRLEAEARKANEAAAKAYEIEVETFKLLEGGKPKWMRRRTFERLAAKHDDLVGRSMQAMMLRFLMGRRPEKAE